ncbi:hypothetical protein SSTU70S_01767 [Stutzerimonas stutzeri]
MAAGSAAASSRAGISRIRLLPTPRSLTAQARLVFDLLAVEQPDHLTDDRQGRRRQVFFIGHARQLLERAAHHLLILAGAVADQRGGGVQRQAGGNQVARDFAKAGQAHVEHQGLLAFGQGAPGQAQFAVFLQVTGDELTRMGDIAVSQWDAGIGAAAGGGGDAGHHLAVHAALEQVFQLLGATAEDGRIATLQAHHALVLQRQPGQQCVDFRLRQAVVAAGLADVVTAAGGGQQGQQAVADQTVIDHGVGLLQQTPGAQGEQAGIARAGTDQGNFAGGERGTQRGG